MTGIPPQAITAAALRLREGHARLGVRLAANDRRTLAADVLQAALPHLAQDGWDAARDRITEANEARRDEHERLAAPMREARDTWRASLEKAARDEIALREQFQAERDGWQAERKQIAAAERECCAQLADRLRAHYGCYVAIGDTVTSGLRPFADRLREQP